MADIYVRSTDGNNADNGSTWALAKLDLAGAAAIDTDGDTIWVSDAHNESTAAAFTLAFAGTLSSPVKIICGDDAAEPPTVSSTAGTFATIGAGSFSITGHLYVYGITFICGSGASFSTITLASASNNSQTYEQCSFQLGNSNSSSRIYPANVNAGLNGATKWNNCTVKFGSAGQRIVMFGCRFEWIGGSILSGGSAVTSLFGFSGAAEAIVRGVDLSEMAASVDICTTGGGASFLMTNCKLSASWSGGLVTGTKNAVFRAEMYNCDSGDTNYVCWIEDGYGAIRDFSTLYLSGTDGIKHNGAAVPLSYKMSGNANTSYPSGTLEGMWMTLVNEATTSQTATLEIIHNESAALNDDEIWLAVDYPAAAGSTQFTRLTDAKADVLAGAAPQASSTADWDDGLTERGNSTAYSAGNIIKSAGTPGSAFICTVGGTSTASVPGGYTSAADGASITDGTATFKVMRRQKLAVIFTAAEQGIIRARPVLAKTNAVIWAASKISVA